MHALQSESAEGLLPAFGHPAELLAALSRAECRQWRDRDSPHLCGTVPSIE